MSILTFFETTYGSIRFLLAQEKKEKKEGKMR
jgi:hypothetical protein